MRTPHIPRVLPPHDLLVILHMFIASDNAVASSTTAARSATADTTATAAAATVMYACFEVAFVLRHPRLCSRTRLRTFARAACICLLPLHQ